MQDKRRTDTESMSLRTTQKSVVEQQRTGTISPASFQELMAARSQSLLRSVHLFLDFNDSHEALNRPLLAELYSQSAQVEEMLDAYGARNTRRWYPFRSLVATIKRFSDAGYELLHIRHVLPSYRLLPIDEDFPAATQEALQFTGDVLTDTGHRLLENARELGLPLPVSVPRDCSYSEDLPSGRLPADRDRRKIGTVSENVAHLATAFLNLAAQSELLHAPDNTPPQRYALLVPDPVSEEHIRDLQYQFHSLQSVYDTYVAGTEMEQEDNDLPVLRGHISVVFHLLSTGVAFAHYYERHVAPRINDGEQPLISVDALLRMLMEYSIAFGGRYVDSARKLCQEMLQRYAEVGEIEVPVPRYRGFHVRPSTLVAKIVMHYGSRVQMKLDGETYDASSPIEIFRANEKINAKKRRWLAQEITRLPLVQRHVPGRSVRATVRKVVTKLAEEGKLVIYQRPLQLPEEPVSRKCELLQQVTDEIARLQATGKVDIEADLTCRFVGDKRVLSDIKLLAENGYGEDNFGNNIDLPERLQYLRR